MLFLLLTHLCSTCFFFLCSTNSTHFALQIMPKSSSSSGPVKHKCQLFLASQIHQERLTYLLHNKFGSWHTIDWEVLQLCNLHIDVELLLNVGSRQQVLTLTEPSYHEPTLEFLSIFKCIPCVNHWDNLMPSSSCLEGKPISWVTQSLLWPSAYTLMITLSQRSTTVWLLFIHLWSPLTSVGGVWVTVIIFFVWVLPLLQH